MQKLRSIQPPKIPKMPGNLPGGIKLPGLGEPSEHSETNSVSTEGLVAAKPHVVNELLFKLVEINTGIEEKLKAYEEKIKEYEKKIKEMEEEPLGKMAPIRVSPVYMPLTIASNEKVVLSKWGLIEEKFGLILSVLCLAALAFLGVTWLDISNSDVTDSNTGWLLRYGDDHGEANIYINQMFLTTCLIFDLTSLMIWLLREFKLFKYDDFRELHTVTSILTITLLVIHFLVFQWYGKWLLLTKCPLYCIVTGGTFLLHLFSALGAKINKIHCFRGDLRFVKTSPTYGY